MEGTSFLRLELISDYVFRTGYGEHRFLVVQINPLYPYRNQEEKGGSIRDSRQPWQSSISFQIYYRS